MGIAGRGLAEGPAGGHGGLLLADRLQAHPRVEGGGRLLGSARTPAPCAGNSAPGRAAIAATEARPTAPSRRPPPAEPAPQTAVFPDGTKIELPPNRDPREVFADWLITPKNPWFTRSIVNRVWAWLLGRGIIHEPDDIRDDNPPSNPELLAYLEKELVASRYDLKRLYRLILNSSTYQFSSMPRFNEPEAEANFASYPLRRLDAEVLIDAINKITGTSDLYTSAIPEPFTYIPAGQAGDRASPTAASPARSWRLFGRSARATGMENERDNKPVPAQWLHLLNSSHIQRKLEQGPKLKAIFESGRKPRRDRRGALPDDPFALPDGRRSEDCRGVRQRPTRRPGRQARQAGKPPPVKRREDWVDIAWALINSTEFLYRH